MPKCQKCDDTGKLDYAGLGMDPCPDCTAKNPGGVEAIAAERKRQIKVERFTPEQDDAYTKGELVKAARSYAWLAILGSDRVIYRSRPPIFWPWHSDWWKPKDRRADLVRAGALIAAEIDRLDRLEAKQQ